MRRFLLIGLSGAALAVLAAWWSFSGAADSQAKGPIAGSNEYPAVKVGASFVRDRDVASNHRAAKVSKSLFDPLEIAPCNLTPIVEQDVSSQVDGIFDEVFVDVGKQVRKGDPLGQLDDRQLRAQVDLLTIRANSLAAERIAKAQFDEADAKVEYAKKANETGLRTVPELEAKTYLFQRERYASEMKKAREEREAAQKELERAKVVLQQHRIQAGVAGEIVKVYKRNGETVKQGEPVFRVANCNSLRVEGLCKIQQASLIRVGMRALVEPEIRGEQMTRLIGHTGAITALAISRDGRLLASAGEDRTVFVWNWPQGTRNAELPHSTEVTAVAFVPTPGDGHTLFTGCNDGQGRLWRLPSTGKPISRTLGEQHEGPLRAVAFSADGTQCATGGDDKRIGVWETASGKLRFWLHAEEGLSAHQGGVTSLRFCPDGQLVSAGRDNVVKVWRLGAKAGTLVRIHTGRTCEVAQPGVSPEGKRILLDLGEELRILERDSGKWLGSLNSRRQGRFQGLAEFSPSGKLVLTASTNQRLQLWRVPTTPEEMQRIRGENAQNFHRHLAGGEICHFIIPGASVVHAGVFAPDESVFFTGGSDKIVRAWAMPSSANWQPIYEARITYVGNQIERGTDMVRIRAELENPADGRRRLRAGMFAALRVFPETIDAK
ncbi:MAG: efflux RND transporter periplasmic adaptor subunit [Planctomycetes bacterium]|nr:efflux RND transporter periplasmic adaptor subunit [Planctomycetota bacterium]